MKSFIGAAVGFAVATAAVSTSLAGISGSGAHANGISGSGSAISRVSGRGIELLVVGPVELVNLVEKNATVLGQRIQISEPEKLAVGDTVAVFGKLRADGTLQVTALESRGLYVPGATPVFLVGRVEKSEPNIGHVVLNGVRVDLTGAMANGAFTPAVGSRFAIAGVQPVGHGIVLVEGISGSGAGTSGISGSGAGTSGISGSGARVGGISGSGAGTSGISGSGAGTSGISGSGARVGGISGSGAGTSGISGSGLR